jgi:hypothetical protein
MPGAKLFAAAPIWRDPAAASGSDQAASIGGAGAPAKRVHSSDFLD